MGPRGAGWKLFLPGSLARPAKLLGLHWPDHLNRQCHYQETNHPEHQRTGRALKLETQ